jgi:hypothetical protein
MTRLSKLIKNHLPSGYEMTASQDSIFAFVPHSLYPKGYHVDPKKPLPYIQVIVQKKHIAFYHMGMYSNPLLLEAYKEDVLELGYEKANTGKSCIRYKSSTLPEEAIIKLIESYSVSEWIKQYESSLNL